MAIEEGPLRVAVNMEVFSFMGEEQEVARKIQIIIWE
jgi:hypothetical protein